jgi:hypothetical protein
MRLTDLQCLVLTAASDVDWMPRTHTIPHGVWRSLVMRGLLTPRGFGYGLTEEGRLAVETLHHSSTGEPR